MKQSELEQQRNLEKLVKEKQDRKSSVVRMKRDKRISSKKEITISQKQLRQPSNGNQ